MAIKILAITGGKNVPSSRFRIREYIKFINNDQTYIIREDIPLLGCYTESKGLIKIFYYIAYILIRLPLIFRQFNYDIIFLQREIFPTFITLEFFLCKPIIYDVDDAVFHHKRGQFVQKYISKKANCVITANEYLFKWYKNLNKNTFIIPTSVDTNRYMKKNSLVKNKNFIFGWIGSSDNFWHLDSIQRPLSKILNKNIKLKVVSNRPYKSKIIDAKFILNSKWKYEKDVDMINSFDVGLMPLIETKWTSGKSSFKAMQYMACEVPVIASKCCYNIYLLNEHYGKLASSEDEWYEILKESINYDFNNITNLARRRIDDKFSIKSNVKALKKIFKKTYEYTYSIR